MTATPPPTEFTIRDGVIHLWVIDLDTSGSLALDSLDATERERAGRLIAGAVRDRYIAAHVAVRRILARYLRVAPAAVPLERAGSGKPFVTGEPLVFSLSHSAGLAVCGLAATGHLGVDIEAVRPMTDADGIVRRMFDAGEAAEYETHQGQDRVAAFFNGWTRKEAFLKATGDGLLRPLDSFQVRVSPSRAPALLRVDGDPGAPGRWSLHAFSPAPGYTGALAYDGRLSAVDIINEAAVIAITSAHSDIDPAARGASKS